MPAALKGLGSVACICCDLQPTARLLYITRQAQLLPVTLAMHKRVLTCAVAAKGRMVSPLTRMTACRAVCRGSTGGGGAGGGGEGGGDGGGDGGGAATIAPTCNVAAITSRALIESGL